MAMYTMELRNYIEKFSQYEQGLSISEKIEIGRPHLFDFYYPIFDEDYRKVFETNFIRHFYMREIGFETEGLFKLKLEDWLNVNMPYWNEMFLSEHFEYDPLTNAQMLVAHEQQNDRERLDDRNINQTSMTDGESIGKVDQESNSTGESTDDNFSRKIGSDNPDSRLALTTEDGRGVIEYASEIDENKTDNKTNTKGQAQSSTDTRDTTHVDTSANQKDRLTSNMNEMEHFLQRRYGKIGADSYPKLITDYRNALLRIERDIHKELNQLFMLVY